MSRVVGFAAEDRAAQFLIERGFRIVERNFGARVGEIDIVALKDGVLHFIEVKYSKNDLPYERITPTKLRRLIKTIDLYLQKRALELPYQLDALMISSDRLELIENITF